MTVKIIYFIKKNYIMASHLLKHILFKPRKELLLYKFWYQLLKFLCECPAGMGTGSFVTSEILEKESKSLFHCVKRFTDSSTQTKEHSFITHYVHMNPRAGSPRAELSQDLKGKHKIPQTETETNGPWQASTYMGNF